ALSLESDFRKKSLQPGCSTGSPGMLANWPIAAAKITPNNLPHSSNLFGDKFLRGFHVDCRAGTSPALHLRRCRIAFADPGSDRNLSHAHRHFSEHQHTGGQHSVELLRIELPGNGQPDR